jgi:hypothetical protein
LKALDAGLWRYCEMTIRIRNTCCSRAPRPAGHGLLAVFLLAGLALSAVASAEKSPQDWALIRLDYARQEKVAQLRSLCDRLHALARQAATDPFVVACFDINLQYFEATEKGPVPKGLVERVAQLRDGFNGYYIQNYFAFYDILFVNTQGDIFYTIRKESDLDTNLAQAGPAGSALDRCLRTVPQDEAFVDFHHYRPSCKPAAFFVEPMHKDGVHVGWIVLQCAINKVNTLLAWTDDLGQTGETFLVNQEGYMLTESNFEGASTILKKRLDDRNVQAKFTEKQGHRTVTDYRGRTALTSFEVVEFLGTQWLVVAKMDTDEIATEHYLQHRRYYADKLLAYLRAAPIAPLRDVAPRAARETLRIDMDEFLKADNGERLHTFGVSTCTGVLATCPGRFAYLAHISPKDKVYGSDGTNLLGPMVKRIKGFDIYRCERRRVVFVVVATHLNALLAIVDKLVEEGFLLSQIKVMYNPHAESATISYDCPQNDLVVTWRAAGSPNDKRVHVMEDAANVGEIIQRVMNAEDEVTLMDNASHATRTTPTGRSNTTHTTVTGEEGGPDMCRRDTF